jgi:hypothetical protein
MKGHVYACYHMPSIWKKDSRLKLNLKKLCWVKLAQTSGVGVEPLGFFIQELAIHDVT